MVGTAGAPWGAGAETGDKGAETGDKGEETGDKGAETGEKEKNKVIEGDVKMRGGGRRPTQPLDEIRLILPQPPLPQATLT